MWHALNFVQKRKLSALDRLVSDCEAAIMLEACSDFQPQLTTTADDDAGDASLATAKTEHDRDSTGSVYRDRAR